MAAMTSEPPDAYVAFVERHLASLRVDAARVVGSERDADLLYPDVLTDVAARWRWLDLRQTRRGRARARERCLREAFERRSARWSAEQTSPVEIEVWTPRQPVPAGPAWAVSFGPYAADSHTAVDGYLQMSAAAARPTWSSVALRLAAHVTPLTPAKAGALAEAAVAWWHAYEAYRRRRFYAGLAFVLMVLMLMTRVRGGMH